MPICLSLSRISTNALAKNPEVMWMLHRPLTAKEDLARILTWQETRTLSKNLTLQFQKTVYQIQTDRPTYALRNAQVTVCVNAQEEITILYNGKALPLHHLQPTSPAS